MDWAPSDMVQQQQCSDELRLLQAASWASSSNKGRHLWRDGGDVEAGPARVPLLLDGDPIRHQPELKCQVGSAGEAVLVVGCDHIPWLPCGLPEPEGHRGLHTLHHVPSEKLGVKHAHGQMMCPVKDVSCHARTDR